MRPPDGDRPDSERDRICAALIALLSETDYGSFSLTQLLRRAGVSRAAFERHFSGLEACFSAVWGEVDAEISAEVTAAYRGEGGWQDRLRAAFEVGLSYLARDPGRARLYVTEAFQVNEELRRRQFDSIARLGQIIDRGRDQATDGEELPLGLGEIVSCAVWRRVDDLVRSGKHTELPGQLHELMYLAVLPYRGSDAAEAELFA